MKFGLAAAALFVFSLAPALARPLKRETLFKLIADNGGDFQNVPIYKVPDHTQVFSVGGDEGYELILTLQSNGSLIDQDGIGVYINSDTGEVGITSAWDDVEPTTGFSYGDDNHLYYNNDQQWQACPSGDNRYSLTSSYECDGGSEITVLIKTDYQSCEKLEKFLYSFGVVELVFLISETRSVHNLFMV